MAQNPNHSRSPVIVENIPTFRRTQEPLEVYHVPEIAEKRKLTDVAFLVVFGICSVVLLSLMTYALCYSDMNRLTHGYDKCGNICGVDNSPVENVNCSGQDMSKKPYLEYSSEYSYFYLLPKSCTENCDTSKFVIKNYRCYPSPYYDADYVDVEGTNFITRSLETLDDESTNLAILCVIGVCLSVLSLVVFRYFLKAFIWTMLIASILLMFGLTGFFWYLYSAYGFNCLYLSIFFTIFSFIFLILMIVLIASVDLIIGFFQEAIRIVFAMPLILLEPFLTFITNFIVIVLFAYTFTLMSSAGTLQKNQEKDLYEYVANGAMEFPLWFSIVMALWMVQFVLACQQMVISGAVSAFYFTRDKLALGSPIYNSFYMLIRYHLGTVAFGSLLITVITILKILMRALSRENSCFRIIYVCCLQPLEDLLKYMTSLGYIETAIHGQPLCRSSVRAINLVVSNFLSAVVMNSIGNYIFFMAKLVVIGLTVLIGLIMKLSALSVCLGALVAFICVHSFFVVFEIAVDTVFICYCEDQCINDGETKPFYTTTEFYQYIAKAQAHTKAIEQKKKKK